MNSRSGVNESSLVNFSTELPSLDAKDSLLSFPFDHLYACHDDSPDQRDSLQLGKDIDLAAQCVIGEDKSLGLIANPEVDQLNNRLTASENQNKRLKDLLIYHLDLIQQQNDLITKRDKLFQALRLENENLKNKLHRRHGLNLPPPSPSPLLLPPPAPLGPLVPLGPPAPRTSIAPLGPPAPRVSTAALGSPAPLAPPATPKPLGPSKALVPPRPFAPPKPLGLPKSLAPPAPLATPAPAAPLVSPTSTTDLSTKSSGANTETNPAMLNSLSELFMPDSRSSSYLFDGKLGQPNSFQKETFGIARTTVPMDTDSKSYAAADSRGSTAESSRHRYPRCERFKPIESKRSYTKKEPAKPEPRAEALYTVTTNSGSPVIQRVQRNRKRNSTGVGHFSRMSKSSSKVEPVVEPSKITDEPKYDHFGINKKNRLWNTYGKSKVTATCTATSTTNTVTKCSMFGSLSDRFQLIDKIPTGEDPYQLGEADLREQSPIPKLMLQKSNQGRMRVHSNQPTRRIYDPDSPEPKFPRRANRFLSSTFTEDLKKEAKTMIVQEPDLDVIKTEPEIDWNCYSPKYKTGIDTFTSKRSTQPRTSFGQSTRNYRSDIQPPDNTIDCIDFQRLFTTEENFTFDPFLESNDNSQDSMDGEKIGAVEGLEEIEKMVSLDVMLNETYGLLPNLEDLNVPLEFPPIPPLDEEEELELQESRKGRKRALSTTGLGRGGKGAKAPAKTRKRGRAATRGRRTSPPPATFTTVEYHTEAGHSDQSWYFGMDAAVKADDLESHTENKSNNVEVRRKDVKNVETAWWQKVSVSYVQQATDAKRKKNCKTTKSVSIYGVVVPRWREKPYTSTYTLEGTENVEDRVFEKRHQKLEAEERRQLRWHMRRIREQRHVEKLKQRQRDSWCTTVTVPSVYTVWPRPHRDLRFIEITDTLPVMAFGEVLPDLPKADFMLPWVRTSKALKRSKRSKTLH